MSFFSRLFKKVKTPVQLICPRCLGKGHVDNGDAYMINQKRDGCPVAEHNRLWLEDAFLLLLQFSLFHRPTALFHYMVSTGSPLGRSIFLESDKGDKNTGGLYWGQGEHGKYEIWLNRRKLSEPESMVATLAHEIAHIKLLGANQAFQTFTKIDSHGWRSQGYLSQMEWGYALALFAYVRGEKSPTWINHLTPNVKSDFLQGQNFIEANPKLVF